MVCEIVRATALLRAPDQWRATVAHPQNAEAMSSAGRCWNKSLAYQKLTMNGILFSVGTEGGLIARALGESIFTKADDVKACISKYMTPCIAILRGRVHKNLPVCLKTVFSGCSARR
jgi:hypothetical protein